MRLEEIKLQNGKLHIWRKYVILGYVVYGMSFEIHVPNNNQLFSDKRFECPV